MLCLAFGYVKAQTILVNSNVISVNEDVTFPFWLDSMSTIEIGTQVVSISALEFNIVPATNGNSLVFSQTKTITSQETVPNGMTWKITAVLLDSTAINNSSSGGGGQVIVSGSGGNMPVALSNVYQVNTLFGETMIYCDSLQEDGYDNWVVPSFEELWFVSGGGGIVPGIRTNNYLFSSTVVEGNENVLGLNLLDGGIYNLYNYAPPYYLRCVRHETISVNITGSSSSGSNTPSTLGSGMPTMISNESSNQMDFISAMIYCNDLQESGYDDWVLPNYDQLTYAVSGGCIINDTRTSNRIFTRSRSFTDQYSIQTIRIGFSAPGVTFMDSNYAEDGSVGFQEYCRCVR